MRKRVVGAFWSSVLGLGVLLLCGPTSFAQDKSSPAPTLRHAVTFEVSPPLRELAKLPMQPNYVLHANSPLRASQRRPSGAVVDEVEQSNAGGGSNFSIGVNVGGLGLGFAGFTTTFNYPDANIAVGDTQIVQWVNNSYAVFDKSGNALTPAMPFNMLWTTGQCSESNPEGHPIAQWDRAAHQWLFAENVVTGPPYVGYACVAVSKGPDATMGYYLYEFPLGPGYPDLAKWGTWSTSFFQSNDNFGADGRTFMGSDPCAYNSAKMLVGDPSAEQMCFGSQLTTNDFALMPADIDSAAQPPVGEDEFLFSLWDSSHLALYSIHVDWPTLTGSITGSNGSQLFTVPAFTPACNGQYLGACVPQLGTSNLLDVLGDRLLYRVAYYDDVTSNVPVNAVPAHLQHWLVLHDATASGGNTAERWYEFFASTTKTTVTSIHLLQSGTYAPDDTTHRWMGSIARDSAGDILLGYSASSASIYPSVAITGRTLNDPNGTMEGELQVVGGEGAFLGIFDYNLNRWGDYTSMRLDPADNCTFWYTNEYYTASGTSNWSTQINSARFSGCPPPK